MGKKEAAGWVIGFLLLCWFVFYGLNHFVQRVDNCEARGGIALKTAGNKLVCVRRDILL